MLYRKKQCGCEKNEAVESELLTSLLDTDGDSTEEFLEQTRRICITGEIDEFTALYVNSQLQKFAISDKPVYMYLSSPGGNLMDGYAIIDQMQLSPFPVHTIVRGQAHSMAAIITAYGTKGRRFITPHSCMMLHSVSLDLSTESIERAQKAFRYVQKDYDELVSDLAGHTRLSPKKLTLLLSETCWMNAKEAIKVGIVDKIWTPKMEQAVNAPAIKEEAKNA